MLLEFAKFGSVHDALQAGTVELDRAKVLRLAFEVASALQYLHDTRRIIHRDVAARNVLLVDDGSARLADFGLSRAMQAAGTMQKRRFPIKFLAPETLITGALLFFQL